MTLTYADNVTILAENEEILKKALTDINRTL